MDFFIREAWAQDAGLGGGDTTAMLVQFGPLILIFAIFLFLDHPTTAKAPKRIASHAECPRQGR